MVVGIKLNENGKTYYFNSNGYNLKDGDSVIVETEKGQQFGTVATTVVDESLNKNLEFKNVIRIANKNDYRKHMNNVKDADRALVKCNELYQNIINNQLGNVIITDNIDSANKISKLLLNRYKVVTLDGAQINVGGSITGGSLSNNQNFLKDKYELESYKLDLQKLIKQNTELESSIKIILDDIGEYDKVKAATTSKINDINENIKNYYNFAIYISNVTNELLQINVNTPLRIIDENSDSSSDDTYSWTIDNKTKEKELYIDFSVKNRIFNLSTSLLLISFAFVIIVCIGIVVKKLLDSKKI